LRLNGVTPTAAALRKGSYPYVKCLSVVSTGRVSRVARSFLDFLNSPEGRAVLERTGNAAGPSRACRTRLCDKK